MKQKEKKPHAKEAVGVISVTARGVGYVTIPESEEDDLEVDSFRLAVALHGDTVKVRVLGKYGKRVQAEGIEVLERAKTPFIGTLLQKGGMWILTPDSRRMHVAISVAPHTELKPDWKALVDRKSVV